MASGPLALIKLFTFASILLSAAYVEAQTTTSGGVLAFDGPRSIQTTSRTTDSNGNPVIQVCSVQLTPITINGEDSVVAVSTCVQTPDTAPEGGGGTSTTTTGSFIATTTSSSVGTPTSTVSIPSSGSISSTSTTSVSGVERPTTTVSTPSSDLIASSSTTLFSSVKASTSTASVPSGDSTSSTSPTSTPASTTSTAGISTVSAPPLSSVTRTSTTRITSTTTTMTSSGTEAAASAAGAVNQGLPGKSISVLPIGLGVFAGLSVIAMIVVGAVTYERTKYRKNFRRQRLAEAGGEMGYGDMAQARV